MIAASVLGDKVALDLVVVLLMAVLKKFDYFFTGRTFNLLVYGLNIWFVSTGYEATKIGSYLVGFFYLI